MATTKEAPVSKTTAPPGHPSVLRRLFSGVLYLIYVLAFSLLLLEILLRATHLMGARTLWTVRDPYVGYRFIPNHHYWYQEENPRPITGKINRYGWRDKDWSIEKPANTYRIACLGDSFVEAYQAESDRTFEALASKQLTQKLKRPVELMNFGRSGFTQSEEFLVLQRDAAKFHPDAVVLFFYPQNDIEDINPVTAGDRMRPYYRLEKDGRLTLDLSYIPKRRSAGMWLSDELKHNSALAALVADRGKKALRIMAERKAGTAAGRGSKLQGHVTLATRTPDPVFAENYRLNKALIKAIADYCKTRHIRFILVCINVDTYEPRVEKMLQHTDPSFDTNYFADDLGRFAGELGIEYIGLEKPFRQYLVKTGKYPHWPRWGTWGHWNYLGHELVSDALVETLAPETGRQ